MSTDESVSSMIFLPSTSFNPSIIEARTAQFLDHGIGVRHQAVMESDTPVLVLGPGPGVAAATASTSRRASASAGDSGPFRLHGRRRAPR